MQRIENLIGFGLSSFSSVLQMLCARTQRNSFANDTMPELVTTHQNQNTTRGEIQPEAISIKSCFDV